MSDIYHLDYETYSPQPLGNVNSVGAFRYAEDPTAQILVMCIAKNNDEPLAWSVLNPDHSARELLREAVESGNPIYAHNSQFEQAISKYLFKLTFGFDPPAANQWRCTQAMCRLAAIPSSLEDAGKYLDVDAKKDKDGSRLIGIFSSPRKPTKSDPRPRIFPEDEPEDFQRFVDYCLQDVRTEREIHKRLHKFELKGLNLGAFLLDARMNERGIPVNRDALAHAETLMAEYYERLIPIFREQVKCPGEEITLPITKQRKAAKQFPLDEGFNPTMIEKMKIWMKTQGFTGDDLQELTVSQWLKDPQELTEKAQKALYTFSLVRSAAIKKIPKMLEMSCSDGYVRGAFKVFGAERTHRWTGSGIQPQNFARPKVKMTEMAYDLICEGGDIDGTELLFGNFFDVLASCIRHFIQPHEGRFLQADYSAIEARVNPWLCRAETILEKFRNDEPVYEDMASKIFGVSLQEVIDAHKADDSEMRFLGKQTVLGCGYQMGPAKFRGTCESYEFSPSDKMVNRYKSKHQAFVKEHIKKKWEQVRKRWDRKNKPVPSRYDDDLILWQVCVEQKWEEIHEETNGDILGITDHEHFRHFCYDELAQRAVRVWRENNSEIVQMWKAIEQAAKNAITNKGEVFTVGLLKFQYGNLGGFNALRMRLPSGHFLIYPEARIEEEKDHERDWNKKVIKFYGVIPNSGGKWGRCSTYGGKLLENATQAAAGDIMKHGMGVAEKHGYEPFMTVHDEMLCVQQFGQTHEELCRHLCNLPKWANGLPLAAEGQIMPFYKK